MNTEGFLTNKVCIVTGASKGIGFATVKKFAEAGAIVYANVRNQDSIFDKLSELSEKFPDLKIQFYDVTKAEEVKNAVMEVKKNEGRIDVLVNNAGEVSYELLAMLNYDKLTSMLDTNVVAVIRLTQLVSRIMSRQKSGSIINISSIVGVKGVKGQLSYAATKGAVNAITLSAAKELAEFSIRVNAVAPGMVATDRLKNVMEVKFSNRLDDIGFGRMAEPEEVADVCLFLASDMSKYVTGQIIGVDGGTVL
ncbi:SDR family NAD(P)-dependent oxidoreductase [Shivajiella indica]|uniref:SDR family NAD(P)-dependent oxidoreductase n=1 Tax=Shivajiella indica TaxID=872115 RepID=A0ABW5B9F9_9BACT